MKGVGGAGTDVPDQCQAHGRRSHGRHVEGRVKGVDTELRDGHRPDVGRVGRILGHCQRAVHGQVDARSTGWSPDVVADHVGG